MPPRRHSVSHLFCIVSLLESTVSKWLLFLISYSFLVTQWGWLPVKSVCQDQEGPSYKSSRLHMGQTEPALWSAFPVASTMPGTWRVLSRSLLNVLRRSVLFDLNNMRIIELLSSFHSHDTLMLGFAWRSWTIHSPPSLPLLIPSVLVFSFYLSLLLIFIHLPWESRPLILQLYVILISVSHMVISFPGMRPIHLGP